MIFKTHTLYPLFRNYLCMHVQSFLKGPYDPLVLRAYSLFKGFCHLFLKFRILFYKIRILCTKFGYIWPNSSRRKWKKVKSIQKDLQTDRLTVLESFYFEALSIKFYKNTHFQHLYIYITWNITHYNENSYGGIFIFDKYLLNDTMVKNIGQLIY